MKVPSKAACLCQASGSSMPLVNGGLAAVKVNADSYTNLYGNMQLIVCRCSLIHIRLCSTS
jgi:hypothetical protein